MFHAGGKRERRVHEVSPVLLLDLVVEGEWGMLRGAAHLHYSWRLTSHWRHKLVDDQNDIRGKWAARALISRHWHELISWWISQYYLHRILSNLNTAVRLTHSIWALDPLILVLSICFPDRSARCLENALVPSPPWRRSMMPSGTTQSSLARICLCLRMHLSTDLFSSWSVRRSCKEKGTAHLGPF